QDDDRPLSGEDSPQESAFEDMDPKSLTSFCKEEQLRDKITVCMKEVSNILRARDVRAKGDICEELRVARDCSTRALRTFRCTRDLSSKEFLAASMKEAFSRYGVDCSTSWQYSIASSATVIGRKLLFAVVLTVFMTILFQ